MEALDVHSVAQLLVAATCGPVPTPGVRYVAGVLAGTQRRHDRASRATHPHLTSAVTIPEILAARAGDIVITTTRPVTRHRPAVDDLQLMAEMTAARRRSAQLSAELAETSRMRYRLRDLLQAIAWHAHLGAAAFP